MINYHDLISQMTLDEKVGMCSGLNYWYLRGVERLGIPSIMVTDGPHGLRKQEGDPTRAGLMETTPATCFPTASSLAATWNRELIHEVGEALGKECRQEKVGVILGPGVNIKRSPLCGRNFEYFSEDPYLTSEIAKHHILGVQSQGIGTSLKHYAVNNQEYRRLSIDAVVDERALREIYLPGYEIPVKESQPWTVMGAYNMVNGTFACEHPELLRTVLKEEWGHEGLVVTDWGAINDPVAALIAGLELEMPGVNNGNFEKLKAAVESGKVDESILDQAVERILALIFKARETLADDYQYDKDAHHALARKAAGEGAVLLKNQDQALPLENGLRIALIGEMAVKPRYQGAGSSLINPSRLDTIYDELAAITSPDLIHYAPGYTARGSDLNQDLIDEALETAKETDVVVICAGLPEQFETEGLDRDHMKMPASHNLLIEALSGAHDRVVVVLSNGAPVEMPWIDEVDAVLEGYLGGQAGAGAIAGILCGIINPSGKLAETFPLKLEDNPSHPNFPGGPKTVEYRESIYVGYRFYDSVGKDVLFPFGHGLSYTQFEYSDLIFDRQDIRDPESLVISFKVKNIGNRAGKEIAQVYIRPLNPTPFRPVSELKGFEKVKLEPGEEKEVKINLDRRAFAYFNTDLKDWHVESGTYQILIGASSRDIRLQGEVKVASSQPDLVISERDRINFYRNFPPDARVPDEIYRELLGRELPLNQADQKGSYTIKTPIEDLDGTLAGKLLYRYMKHEAKKLTHLDPDSPTALMIHSMIKTMPLRTLMIFGGDRVNPDMMDGLLVLINRGFFYWLVSRFRNRN